MALTCESEMDTRLDSMVGCRATRAPPPDDMFVPLSCNDIFLPDRCARWGRAFLTPVPFFTPLEEGSDLKETADILSVISVVWEKFGS